MGETSEASLRRTILISDEPNSVIYFSLVILKMKIAAKKCFDNRIILSCKLRINVLFRK